MALALWPGAMARSAMARSLPLAPPYTYQPMGGPESLWSVLLHPTAICRVVTCFVFLFGVSVSLCLVARTSVLRRQGYAYGY